MSRDTAHIAVPTREETSIVILQEVRRMAREMEEMRREISRLTTKIQRPDLQKYTVSEATERLGRSRTSIYAEIREGRLESVTEKGRRYITEEAVQSWERRHRDS